MDMMVLAATKLDEEALTRAVVRFKALADRTRLGILLLIVRKGEPICVCEINESFDLEQPTISHHLKVLREAGFVLSERRANWAYYFLNPDAEAWVRGTLSALRD
jgi:ArsR family transcriptional regulator